MPMINTSVQCTVYSTVCVQYCPGIIILAFATIYVTVYVTLILYRSKGYLYTTFVSRSEPTNMLSLVNPRRSALAL